MDPLKLQQNPFLNQSSGVNPNPQGAAAGVNAQPPSIQPVFGGKTSSSQGIPQAAHDKFAQNGINNFDASKLNPFQPDTRNEDQGQNLYLMA